MEEESEKIFVENALNGVVFYASFAVVMYFLCHLVLALSSPSDPTENYSWIHSINNLLGIFPSFAYSVNLPSLIFEKYKRRLWHSILLGSVTPFLFIWEDRNPLIFLIVLISFPIFLSTILIGIKSKLEQIAGGNE